MDAEETYGGPEYGEQCAIYDGIADAISSTDTIAITGIGCSLKVWSGALVITSGKTHIPQKDRVTKLYRGVHSINRIIILSDDGYVSLSAIEWCVSQNIQVVVIDNMGRILLTTGDTDREAKLRRLQYQAGDTGMDGYIARELIQMKTLSQIQTLKHLPRRSLRYNQGFVFSSSKRIPVSNTMSNSISDILKILEDGLVELSDMRDINAIMKLEGRLAFSYWNALIGLPIKWDKKVAHKVPPHWKEIGERMSTLSSGNTARYATNPFQSALNYGYAVLKTQVLKSVQSAGLDVSCGFLHSDKVGRDSLCYDLMEPHRPQVDQMVYKLFSALTFTKGMVIPLETGECKLNPQFARLIVVRCSVPQKDIDATVRWVADTLRP
jgi:CRISP-associated protein Cas1